MHAFTEAELRGCAVLLVQRRRSVSSQHRLDAFERLVNRMQADHPDVEVHLAAVGTDVAAFLAAITASVAVTIVDGVSGPARPRQRDAFPSRARWIGVQSLSAELCATVG
jgi:hypothetical protein